MDNCFPEKIRSIRVENLEISRVVALARTAPPTTSAPAPLAPTGPSRCLVLNFFWKQCLYMLAASNELAMITSSPPCSGRASSSTRLLSLVIRNVFIIFVITIPKTIISAVFLSFVCLKRLTIQVCKLTYDRIQSHT